MQICSFLPSATEILYALGLGNSIAGVTFECDFPPETAILSLHSRNWLHPSHGSRTHRQRSSTVKSCALCGLWNLDLR